MNTTNTLYKTTKMPTFDQPIEHGELLSFVQNLPKPFLNERAVGSHKKLPLGTRGVYIFYDEYSNEVLYVGKSTNLYVRIQNSLSRFFRNQTQNLKVIVIKTEDIDELEKHYISMFNPLKNRVEKRYSCKNKANNKRYKNHPPDCPNHPLLNDVITFESILKFEDLPKFYRDNFVTKEQSLQKFYDAFKDVKFSA